MGNLNETAINEILGVRENFELPEKLMSILHNESERNMIFRKFLDIEPDLSFDWFTEYFQEGKNDRKKLMQEFTPKALAELAAYIAGPFRSCLDVCAGTGGLTIAAWNRNRGGCFRCEDVSRAAFPLLLFNMAIRNMRGVAINRDILTGETFAAYVLEKGETFSRIRHIEKAEEAEPDICLMNPPYSARWDYDEKKEDERMSGYGYPPKSRADYGFLLHGLHTLASGGKLCAIMSPGVLYRGGKEEAIRKGLVEHGYLRGIIQLPEKLFLNTPIAVCLMTFEKCDSDAPVLFIDATHEYEAGGRQNTLQTERIRKAYAARQRVRKFCECIYVDDIRAKDYSLSVSMYVDTSEEKPPIDMRGLSRQILESRKKLAQIDRAWYELIQEIEDDPAVLETERQITEVWK